MWQWISNNSSALSVISSFLTFVLWLVYLQMLYQGFKRQRQPKIIVNRGGGSDLNARCVISNMSSESIFIEHLVAALHTDKGVLIKDLTDLGPSRDDDNLDNWENLNEVTRQGPMLSGSYSHIGSFADTVKTVLQAYDIPADGPQANDGHQLQAIEIRVIAVYGSEDQPVGASRTFNVVETNEGQALQPASIETKRYATRWKRRQVNQWIRDLEH
ncbi:hypothetical protein [Salinicola aestuarinus]|uniref:hypothetical protein n=1 Tax=Salinicola aestuarinus TaxID=1949082 RepID=UPI000DA13073|nr:hypothetical protein [Salinicola aestuarinus]